MSRTGQRPESLSYRAIGDGGRHLFPFFMLESLLEARSQSTFPTGHQFWDEDVNIYLAHLLSEHLLNPVPDEVSDGGTPLLSISGEEEWSGWRRLEHFRRNGDHRLLSLGLYGRGDLVRRRTVPLGYSEDSARLRDLEIGQSCYRCAVALLLGSGRAGQGLTEVLNKLAAAYQDYVHVLQTLARRNFGLGARLDEDELRELIMAEGESDEVAADAEGEGLDSVLDALSAYRKNPTRTARERLATLAGRHGISLGRLLGEQ